ncbi:MAG TPA: DUF2782 domain-containing protein [Usitatibacteraceae bacterium]
MKTMVKKIACPLIFALSFAAALPAFAQSKEHPKPKDLQAVEAPPPPPKVTDDDLSVEGKVTIVKKGTDTVEEYRLNGKLYKMRVVPAGGAAYFLVDPKGDGNFSRVDGPAPKIAVPTWVLIEWK